MLFRSPLGTWVLHEACSAFAAWQRRFPEQGLDCITVNVSSRQLKQHNFVGIVEQAVRRARLNPADLRLEITETALIEDFASTRHLIGACKTLGVKVAMDDFGAGHTSFRNLRDLAFDGALAAHAATPELLARLESAGPFGAGNSEPRFAIPAAAVVKADPVGDGHVRVILGGGSGGGCLKGIAFRALETPVGQALLSARGTSLHVAGHLRADTWQGAVQAQLVIEDAAQL